MEGTISCNSSGIYTAEHEYDCRKYYECVNGNLHERECGGGTYYNNASSNGTCVHQHTINCTKSYPLTSSTSTSEFNLFTSLPFSTYSCLSSADVSGETASL